MLQIVFNEISAAEMSALPKDLQLDLLAEFQFLPEDLDNLDEEKFGVLERDGKRLFRYRANGIPHFTSSGATKASPCIGCCTRIPSAIFFSARSCPMTEDDQLGQQKGFWKLIEEAEQTRQK